MLEAVNLTHIQLKRPRRFPEAAFVPADDDDDLFARCFLAFDKHWRAHLHANNTTGMFLVLSNVAETFLCSKSGLAVTARNEAIYCRAWRRGACPRCFSQPATAVSRPAKVGGSRPQLLSGVFASYVASLRSSIAPGLPTSVSGRSALLIYGSSPASVLQCLA